jgi:hypothetical protein
MIFLIEYDRPSGLLVSLEDFDDGERQAAEQLRLQRELELNLQGLHHEVVLLEAANKDAIQRTHKRYFMSAEQIVTSSSG